MEKSNKVFSDRLLKRINDKEKKQAYMRDTGLDASFLDNVVMGEFTQWELTCAFELIANKENWKLALNGVIDSNECEVVKAAAIHMAGSPLEMKPCNDKYIVNGPGYYECIGA